MGRYRPRLAADIGMNTDPILTALVDGAIVAVVALCVELAADALFNGRVYASGFSVAGILRTRVTVIACSGDVVAVAGQGLLLDDANINGADVLIIAATTLSLVILVTRGADAARALVVVTRARCVVAHVLRAVIAIVAIDVDIGALACCRVAEIY